MYTQQDFDHANVLSPGITVIFMQHMGGESWLLRHGGRKRYLLSGRTSHVHKTNDIENEKKLSNMQRDSRFHLFQCLSTYATVRMTKNTLTNSPLPLHAVPFVYLTLRSPWKYVKECKVP